MEDLPISAVTSHFNLPANNHFWPTSLFQHVQHFRLRIMISRNEHLDNNLLFQSQYQPGKRDQLLRRKLPFQIGAWRTHRSPSLRETFVKNEAKVFEKIQLTDIDLTCVFVDELSKHETHDLHRDSSAAVLQHLEQGQGGDVNLIR